MTFPGEGFNCSIVPVVVGFIVSLVVGSADGPVVSRVEDSVGGGSVVGTVVGG